MVAGLTGPTGLTAVLLVATVRDCVSAPAPNRHLSTVARTALEIPLTFRTASSDTVPFTVNGSPSLPGPPAACPAPEARPTGHATSIQHCTVETIVLEIGLKSGNATLMLVQVQQHSLQLTYLMYRHTFVKFREGTEIELKKMVSRLVECM